MGPRYNMLISRTRTMIFHITGVNKFLDLGEIEIVIQKLYIIFLINTNIDIGVQSHAGVTKFDNINIHIKILNKLMYRNKDR
jgi:hypothetical protein